MFVHRQPPTSRLPSFNELVLSLAHEHASLPPLRMPLAPLYPSFAASASMLARPNPLAPPLPLWPQQLRLASCVLLSASDTNTDDTGYAAVAVPARAQSLSPHTDDTLSASPRGQSPRSSLAMPSAGASKRKHTCKTCGRPFTTLGHLARHNRIHTGERNHLCPFPNCRARFARQDNCMQHYKIHISGKSKRGRS